MSGPGGGWAPVVGERVLLIESGETATVVRLSPTEWGLLCDLEIDPPAGTVKQCQPVAVLQHADRRADGRRRQVKRLGRLRQVLSVGHGDEDAQLFQRHHLFDPIE